MKTDLSIKQLIPADPRDYLLVGDNDLSIPIVVFHILYECKDKDGNTVQKIDTVGTDHVDGPVRQNRYSDWIDIDADFGEYGGNYLRAISPIWPGHIRNLAKNAVDENDVTQSDFDAWKRRLLAVLKSRNETVIKPGVLQMVENATTFYDLIY